MPSCKNKFQEEIIVLVSRSKESNKNIFFGKSLPRSRLGNFYSETDHKYALYVLFRAIDEGTSNSYLFRYSLLFGKMY